MHHLGIILFAMLALVLGTVSSASAQAPLVNIKPQPESPMVISLVRITSDDSRAPSFEYRVLNNGDKPIRAYTIRQEDGLVGSFLSMLKTPLRQGQSQLNRYGDATYSDPVKEIVLSVDFLEFADGTVWGPDTTLSSQRLAGTRAGMGAERARLLKVLKDGGAAAVISALKSSEEVAAPAGNSSEWSEGFRTGTLQYRARLRRIQGESGFASVESTLQQPSGEWEE